MKNIIYILLFCIVLASCKAVRKVLRQHEKTAVTISVSKDSVAAVKQLETSEKRATERITEETETTVEGKTVKGSVTVDFGKAVKDRSAVDWSRVATSFLLFDSSARIVSQKLDTANSIITAEFETRIPETRTRTKKTTERDTEEKQQKNTEASLRKTESVQLEDRKILSRKQVATQTAFVWWKLLLYGIPALVLLLLYLLYRRGLVGKVWDIFKRKVSR